MKNTPIIIFGLFLFFILLLSVFSSTVVIPYKKDTLFSNEYPYEGFSEINDKKEKKGPIKVEGFEGLQSSPLGDGNEIDLFSKLPSNKTCEPGPYSNSTGYLCYDKTSKDLLMTRGGNQTTPSQIGSS